MTIVIIFKGAKSPVVLELPHQWLWEIIDEFVYQFQSFALFRCSLHKKSGFTKKLDYSKLLTNSKIFF